MRAVMLLVVSAMSIASSNTASAGIGDGGGCSGGTDGGSITAECPMPGRPGANRPSVPSRPSGPQSSGCVWVRVTLEEYKGDLPQTGDREVDWFVHTDGSFGRIQADGNRQVLRQLTDCGDRTDEFRWVDVYSVQDAIDDAVDRAKRQIPTPTFEISPDDRGIVNIGMWLSVPNADPISVRAGVGSIWAEATATFTTSAWDMGDGEIVECDGPGEAIDRNSRAYNDPAPGPCGYTYTQRSPSGEMFTISVTGTWTVTWVASDGRSGGGDTISRTGTRPYDVNEIQIVGTGNGS